MRLVGMVILIGLLVGSVTGWFGGMLRDHIVESVSAQGSPDCTDGDPTYFDQLAALDGQIADIDERLRAGEISFGEAEAELISIVGAVLTLDPSTAFEQAHDTYEMAVHTYHLAISNLGFGPTGEGPGMAYYGAALEFQGLSVEQLVAALESCGLTEEAVPETTPESIPEGQF